MNPILSALLFFAFTCISFSSYSQQNETKTDSLIIIRDTTIKKPDRYAEYFQLRPSLLPTQYLFNFKDTVFEDPNVRKIIPNIYFDFDKWTIRPESFVMLDSLHDYLNHNPNLVIQISCHTDSRGSDKYSIKLSQKRAQALVDYLVLKGIAREKLIAVGFQEVEPLAFIATITICEREFLKGQKLTHEEILKASAGSKTCQECLHQLNRRVTIKIISRDYKGK